MRGEMNKCTHCDQMLLTLDEFAAHNAEVTADFVRRFGEFLRTDQSLQPLGYAETGVHESARWLDFVLFLLGQNHMELSGLREMLTDIDVRIASVVEDKSGHKH